MESIGLAGAGTRPGSCLRPDLKGYLYTVFEKARIIKPDEATLITIPHLDSTYVHAPPEIKAGAPVDPFAVDVYMVGRVIYAWLEVRRPLVHSSIVRCALLT